MFRASQIPSEETLPALGHTSLIATGSDIIEESSDTTSTKEDLERRSSYGIAVILPTARNKYPKAVAFILAAKFFEAFAANGIRTILALYLRDDLFFSESYSTIMLHIFNFFGQFCPIFGAILADSYLGNIRTIATFCFLYAGGWILLIMTSLPSIGVSISFLVSISLLMIAIGNGSIRACITSLGALQFRVPEQARQLADYFSLYYFIYYIGIFLSKLLPPFVRAETQCFNKPDCYPAVFGTLGSSFLASWFIFSLGRFFYKREKLSDENILVKFYGCIKHALVVKWSLGASEKRPKYWLHNAIGRYERGFVNDVAKALKITKLFLPLPIYFALLAQQDSSWTFQAAMMNTTVAGVTIQPDQAKAVGPIILFLLIPLWQYICTPLIKRYFNCELKPLHSVTVGGVFSALSFIFAGILQEFLYDLPYKSVSILWQIPQFFFLMLGELLLSIPGLQFAFTEAPASMKSVLTAAWFLNNAFGNLIVVIFTKLHIFKSQSGEYLFYGFLMLVSIIIFTLLAYDYVLHERLGSFYSSHNDFIAMTSPLHSDLPPPNEKDYLNGRRLQATLSVPRDIKSHLHDKDNIPSTSAAAAFRLGGNSV